MSDQPMTRRQRREAERAAAQRAQREHADALALAPAAGPVAASPAPVSLPAGRRSRLERRSRKGVASRYAAKHPTGDSTADATMDDSTADATTANRSTAVIARAAAASAAKELAAEEAATAKPVKQAEDKPIAPGRAPSPKETGPVPVSTSSRRRGVRRAVVKRGHSNTVVPTLTGLPVSKDAGAAPQAESPQGASASPGSPASAPSATSGADSASGAQKGASAPGGGPSGGSGEGGEDLPRSYRPRRGAAQGSLSSRTSRPTGIGALGRALVLLVLAVITVVVPLTGKVPDVTSFALENKAGTGTEQASSEATGSSLAAPILGSDADADPAANAELNNVPDAATLARIREAYKNASQSCAVKAGASGEAAAFITPPDLYMPMIAGTYTVSSPFGYRLHPTLGYVRLHAGQDWSAPVGTPIYAAAAGTVTMAGMDAGLGIITIRHELKGQVWYTRYLHMYQDGIYVRTGQEVKAGDLIAGVGSTGQSTGPHLHFEVRTADNYDDSSAVEPGQWLKDQGAVELSSDCK